MRSALLISLLLVTFATGIPVSLPVHDCTDTPGPTRDLHVHNQAAEFYRPVYCEGSVCTPTAEPARWITFGSPTWWGHRGWWNGTSAFQNCSTLIPPQSSVVLRLPLETTDVQFLACASTGASCQNLSQGCAFMETGPNFPTNRGNCLSFPELGNEAPMSRGASPRFVEPVNVFCNVTDAYGYDGSMVDNVFHRGVDGRTEVLTFPGCDGSYTDYGTDPPFPASLNWYQQPCVNATPGNFPGSFTIFPQPCYSDADCQRREGKKYCDTTRLKYSNVSYEGNTQSYLNAFCTDAPPPSGCTSARRNECQQASSFNAAMECGSDGHFYPQGSPECGNGCYFCPKNVCQICHDWWGNGIYTDVLEKTHWPKCRYSDVPVVWPDWRDSYRDLLYLASSCAASGWAPNGTAICYDDQP